MSSPPVTDLFLNDDTKKFHTSDLNGDLAGTILAIAMPARADGDFSTYSDLKGPHFGARYPKKWEYPEISNLSR